MRNVLFPALITLALATLRQRPPAARPSASSGESPAASVRATVLYRLPQRRRGQEGDVVLEGLVRNRRRERLAVEARLGAGRPQGNAAQQTPASSPPRWSGCESGELDYRRAGAGAARIKGGFHAAPACRPKGTTLTTTCYSARSPPGSSPPSTPARIWRVHPQEHLTRSQRPDQSREPEFDPSRPGLRTRGDSHPAQPATAR